MKLISYAACLISLFTMQFAAAEIPVTMSGPTPAIVSSASAGTATTYTFSITNNVPKSLPITVGGIAAPVSRVTSTSNDCGNSLPPGPTTCNISISIAPTSANSGQTVNQTLTVDYQARTPLIANISFTVPPVPQVSNIAYVTQYAASNGVVFCATDPVSGLLSNCQDAGGHSVLDNTFPQGITLNSTGTIAYLTGYTDTSYAYQCTINQTNGTFSSCSRTNITTPAGYNPEYGMITLNAAGTVAFIVDASSGTARILACPINSGVISATCSNTGATGVGDDPVGIVFNAAGTLAFIGDYDTGFVTECNVNGSTFSSCNNKTGDGTIVFSDPVGVALNNTGSILYIADNASKNIYGCNTTPNGASLFSHCFIATTVTGNSTVWGITLNATNTFALVTDFNNTTYSCPILSGGTFSACTAKTSFTSPVGLALLY